MSLAVILTVIGMLLVLGNGVLIIIDAFRTSIVWGLLCLFFWPVQIAFVLINWSDEKGRLLWMAIGLLILILGVTQLPSSPAAGAV
jgi:hypothetical protein